MKWEVAVLLLLQSLVILPVNGFWLGKFHRWISGAGSSVEDIEHSTEHYEFPSDSFHPDITADESGESTDFEVSGESGTVKPGWNYASNVIVNQGPPPLAHNHNPIGYSEELRASSTPDRGVNPPGGVPGPVTLEMTDARSHRSHEHVDNDLESVDKSVNSKEKKSKSNKVATVHEVSLYNIAVLDENGSILYTEQVEF